MSAERPQRVQLGYIAGAHGVRGALRIKLFNAESDTLAPGVKVELCPRDGQEFTAHEVQRFAPKPGSDQARLWLAQVEGRDAAEALRGFGLWVSRAQLPELDEHEFYLADLIGLEVERLIEGMDPEHGVEIVGRITGVTSNTVQPLLSVRLRGREWLLPAIPPFIKHVDLGRGRVLVDVHEDLFSES